MAGLSRLDISEFSDLSLVAKWYIALRWTAVAGLSLVLLAIPSLVQVRLPVPTLWSLTLGLALLNTVYQLYFARYRGGSPSRSELLRFFEAQVVGDFVVLALLVYFTGFLENPFLYFFVFHVLLTAYLFRGPVVLWHVAALAAAASAAAGLEAAGVLPRHPLFEDDPAVYATAAPPRLAGFCATMAIAGYLGVTINDKLRDTAHSVAIELNRYRSLDRIKSNFILQVTHELRGPLAAVKGYHELLERGVVGALEPRQAEVLGKATRRTDDLLRMIDEMLDYAYMESEGEGETRFAPTRVLLAEALAANVEALAQAAAAKSIALEWACAPGLAVRASRDLVDIILGNLLSNAIRYSGEGRRVSAQARRAEGEVLVEVRDEGIGMSPQELEHLFEEFWRARKAREIERDGTGLGLAITKRAVERLGGRIVVSSETGKGTTFHIYLPRED